MASDAPKREFKETVISDLGRIGHQNKYRVRVISVDGGAPRLDVREYITNDQFEGFTRKGIRLDQRDVAKLFAQAQPILAAMGGEVANG